nr:tlde1 domain-containing protein [Yersinia pestis]
MNGWLVRDDGKIDDYTWINNVERGNFRLHPIGPMRVSMGVSRYNMLPIFRCCAKPYPHTNHAVNGTKLMAMGVLRW